jgi:hypothetical protein
LIGRLLSALGLASLIGGMLLFGVVMAPLVFTKLPPDVAGPFIRQLFPCYYWFVIVSAAVAATGFALRRQTVETVALLTIVAVTCWLQWWLIPHLNLLREAGNGAAFARGHRLSVWVNGAELLTALAVLLKPEIRQPRQNARHLN